MRVGQHGIRVAFVGLGRICSLLEDDPLREKPASHAGAFAQRDDCQLVGGYDVDESRKRGFASRWQTWAAPSFDALLSEGRPDIVVVATHPDSHPAYARAVHAAGIPVMVMEKPVARNSRGVRPMLRAERKGPTRVVVNHERRFSRDYRLVRDAIRAREFGSLIGISARLYFGQTARRDRVLLHDGTHLIDAIHFLTDDSIALRRRVGRLRSHRGNTVLHGKLRSARVPTMIEIGSGRDYLLFEIELSFASGRITVGNGAFRWEESVPSPFYSRYRSLADLNRRPPEPTGYFAGMAAEAVRLVHDPHAISVSAIRDGRAALNVIKRAAWLW